MKKIKLLWIIGFALICAATHAQEGTGIVGAGATFPGDVYQTWASGFTNDTQVPLRYDAVGSGEGMKRIVAHQVDFGASDIPLSPEELSKQGLLQFPTLVGGLVPTVNIKGVNSGKLRLNGVLLAKIFSGQITAWNHPEIAALNRSLSLPAKAIRLIVREDASGGTKTFTTYLSAHDSEWVKRNGVGPLVNWPGSALAAKGTKGVAALLKSTDGGIAYLSFDTVRRQKLVDVSLQNRAGRFVTAGVLNFQAAMDAGALGSPQEAKQLLDLPGVDTWPITETTYILMPKVAINEARTKAVLRFFYWVFAQGDAMAADTGFAPLPMRIQASIIRLFKEVKDRNGEPVHFLSDQPMHIFLAPLTVTP